MTLGEERGDTVAFTVRKSRTTVCNKLVCSVCNKTEHESKECFTIIGYPDWWPKVENQTEAVPLVLGGRGNRTGGRKGFAGGHGDNPYNRNNSSSMATTPSLNSMDVSNESSRVAMHMAMTNSKNPPPGLFTENQ